MKRALISLTLLLSLSVHATLVTGPESAVTNAPLDVAGFSQTHGRIATDGTGFFAVWRNEADIHGTAVDQAGKRLHDIPLVIATGVGADDPPAIDAGGGGYLIAWTASLPEVGYRLQTRLVTVTGAMTPILDLGASIDRSRPQVAFNGTNFLVMWLAPELRLRGAVVRFNGELVRTFDIASAEQIYPDVPLVATGNLFSFAIARIDLNAPPGADGNSAAVHLVSVSDEGVVGAPVVLAPALSPVFNLRADERGGTITVAWNHSFLSPTGLISSVRVTNTGPSPVDTFEAGPRHLHDVIAASSGFLLVYGRDDDRRARYAGSASESTLSVPLPPMTVEDGVSNGATSLLLASARAAAGQFSPLGNDLYLQRLDGAPLEPLSVAPRHQEAPAVAAAGDLRLAVWSEHFGAQRRLSLAAARIDAAGQVLDPNGIDLGMQMTLVPAPYVASNGTDWLITWWENGKIYGTRVARNGTRLDATPFVIADNAYASPGDQYAPVSWDGERYVVAFVRGTFFRGLRSTIIVTHVRPDGSVEAPELALAEIAANDAPALASDPATGQTLVVWSAPLRVGAALVSRGGSVVPVALPSQFVNRHQPAVAWNSGSFLAASAYDGSFGRELRWHMVSPTGVVQTPLSSWIASQQTLPWPALDVEPFGDGFLLYANNVAAEVLDVTASRITAQGLLADGPRVVARSVHNPIPPFAAAGSLLLSTRGIGHPVSSLTRVFFRTLIDIPGAPKRRAVR